MTARVAPPPDALLTAEEFLRLPPVEGRQELHDGVVVEMPPPSPGHGALQSRLARRLGNWCEANGLPDPLGEMACRLAPRRVVGPDLSWLRPGPRQRPGGGAQEGAVVPGGGVPPGVGGGPAPAHGHGVPPRRRAPGARGGRRLGRGGRPAGVPAAPGRPLGRPRAPVRPAERFTFCLIIVGAFPGLLCQGGPSIAPPPD